LLGGIKHIHNTNTRRKKTGAKNRKKTIFFFSEPQYSISETEERKGCGRETKRIRGKKGGGSTLWPLQNNVFFDHGDCGFCRVLSRT
jgi:hypothetical protein